MSLEPGRLVLLIALAGCPKPDTPGPADTPAPHAGAAPTWTAPRTPVITPVTGTGGLSAQACGACHVEIAAEWAASTHAHAWVDRQFQAELHKDPEVGWLCINCHTPLANQQAELTTPTDELRAPERVANPAFDEALQQEGITCLACHWRPEGIAAPHADTNAPHPTVYEPELTTEVLCVSCHQAVARLEDALVCTFDTGREWATADPGRTCPECHMPRVTRPVAVGAPPREGRRHTWPGSLIPKDDAPEAELAFMVDWEPGLDARLELAEELEGTARATATLTNVRAGHHLPTGDPERFLRVTLRALGADDTELAEESWRIGQTWTWYPVAERTGDNRLQAGESRDFELVVPAGATVELTVDHVRLSEENAAFHGLEDMPNQRRVVTLRQAPDTPPSSELPTGGASPTPGG